MSNVEIWNGASGGAWSEFGGGSADSEAFWSDVKIREYKQGSGLYWSGPNDSTFTNVIVASLDSAIQLASPTVYCIYIKGTGIGGHAAGEIFTNVHTWGRAHYGFYGDGGAFLANNCTAEGAFLANVVYGAPGNVWMGGQVFGNAGVGPNAGETGFQFGTATQNTSRNVVQTFVKNFAAGGFPISFVATAGHSFIRMAGQLGTATAFYKGTPFFGTLGDWVELMCHDHGNLSVSVQQVYSRFPDGLSTRTKAGPVGDADFAMTPIDGTFAIDTTNSKLCVRVGGVWKTAVLT